MATRRAETEDRRRTAGRTAGHPRQRRKHRRNGRNSDGPRQPLTSAESRKEAEQRAPKHHRTAATVAAADPTSQHTQRQRRRFALVTASRPCLVIPLFSSTIGEGRTQRLSIFLVCLSPRNLPLVGGVQAGGRRGLNTLACNTSKLNGISGADL